VRPLRPRQPRGRAGLSLCRASGALMADLHYTGHDPETGCGLMLAVALLCLALVGAVLVAGLTSGLWQP
jgi:hypothetical protein